MRNSGPSTFVAMAARQPPSVSAPSGAVSPTAAARASTPRKTLVVHNAAAAPADLDAQSGEGLIWAQIARAGGEGARRRHGGDAEHARGRAVEVDVEESAGAAASRRADEQAQPAGRERRRRERAAELAVDGEGEG